MSTSASGGAAKKWILRLGLGGLLLFLVGSGLYTGATLTYSYSKGERIGFVQKISTRGWVCKTWEGELSLIQVPGQQAPAFAFTVRDDKTAKAIQGLAGHKVALHYEQHRGVPTSCFGDTEYFVVGVEKAD